MSEPVPEILIALMERNGKARAIKVLRELTGLSLTHSKVAVDALAEHLTMQGAIQSIADGEDLEEEQP